MSVIDFPAASAPIVGLIFPQAEPMGALRVGGIPVLERQARLLRHAGVEVVLALDAIPGVNLPAGVQAVSKRTLAERLIGAGRVAVMAPGLVLDERAVAAMLAQPGATLLVSDATVPGAAGVERLDALTHARGFMVLPARMVRDTLAGLGEWDLASTLLRSAATDAAVVRLPLESLPLYAPARRRDVPMLWALPKSPEDAARATDRLIAAAQKGCLDWPARFVHPLIEDALVRALAPTRITPNMVTLFTALLGLGAGVAFWHGWLWTGLILALICGPLDGVDGKLARTRMEFSRWGDLEHVLDKIMEYGWYLALAAWFARDRAEMLPWAVAALIILPAVAEATQGEFFRRMTGGQLDDAGALERRIRLFAGRRNTFLWSLLPFAALSLWFDGFVFLAVYSVATTVVAQWRFYVRLAAYGREHGPRIAANFADTAYSFLPRR